MVTVIRLYDVTLFMLFWLVLSTPLAPHLSSHCSKKYFVRGACNAFEPLRLPESTRFLWVMMG
jgi:hypothetical protein